LAACRGVAGRDCADSRCVRRGVAGRSGAVTGAVRGNTPERAILADTPKKFASTALQPALKASSSGFA
jgi:hypothetical protein